MTFLAGVRNDNVWGFHYFLTTMVKLAKQVKFANPTQCTGYGKLTEGISHMVNSKTIIPLCESMKVAWHLSTKAHLGYAGVDEEAHAKKY